MRAKCAIIASNVSGNSELLANDRGLLVESNPQKFAQAIDYLLSDNQKRFELAQKAHEYFCKKHRLEDQVKKLIGNYLDGINVKSRTFDIAGCYRNEIYS